MADPKALALYYFEGCPFCARVQEAADRLEVALEYRDIQREPARREELVEATGRKTVPCLRIEEPSGEVRWMHESEDIVGYLERHARAA